MNRFIKIFTNPKSALKYMLIKTARLYGDELFLKMMFPLRVGYKLNLNNPKTYNEKLQWMKLHNRKSIYTKMVDKVEAKEFVANIIGEEYIIPTLGVYNSADDIDFDSLPKQFVLKCTHDSGGIVVCKDKSRLNIKEAKNKLRKGLRRCYYYQNREWPYKNVPRRIIAEKYMVDESGYELKDYKFFCFDGKVELLFIATDRTKIDEEVKFDFFDANFNHLPIVNGHPNSNKLMTKPKEFEQMKLIAEKLSKGLPHLRVDLYNVNGKIYFGELTFFHFSGMVPFNPMKWDIKLGEMIDLAQCETERNCNNLINNNLGGGVK